MSGEKEQRRWSIYHTRNPRWRAALANQPWVDGIDGPEIDGWLEVVEAEPQEEEGEGLREALRKVAGFTSNPGILRAMKWRDVDELLDQVVPRIEELHAIADAALDASTPGLSGAGMDSAPELRGDVRSRKSAGASPAESASTPPEQGCTCDWTAGTGPPIAPGVPQASRITDPDCPVHGEQRGDLMGEQFKRYWIAPDGGLSSTPREDGRELVEAASLASLEAERDRGNRQLIDLAKRVQAAEARLEAVREWAESYAESWRTNPDLRNAANTVLSLLSDPMAGGEQHED